ncbi:hypothetical protein J4211_03060 [Candidatus Woesearchaeota archaeon]|nr:hypothetical protein [Candidatus Woesearchaeota archaeon]
MKYSLLVIFTLLSTLVLAQTSSQFATTTGVTVTGTNPLTVSVTGWQFVFTDVYAWNGASWQVVGKLTSSTPAQGNWLVLSQGSQATLSFTPQAAHAHLAIFACNQLSSTNYDCNGNILLNSNNQVISYNAKWMTKPIPIIPAKWTPDPLPPIQETPVTESCKGLILKGPSQDKLNIVFVPDYSYSALPDFTTFANDVKKHLQVILSVEPFKSNANKINFYRVDKISEDVKCGLTKNECGNRATALSQECPSDKTIVIVKSGISGYASSDSRGSINTAVTRSCDESVLNVYGMTPHCGPMNEEALTIHELGHALGLADMYVIGQPFGFDYSYIVNCDGVGCKKWCSGEPDLRNYVAAKGICQARTQENCLGDALSQRDEQGNYKWPLYRCGVIEGKCDVREGYENVGTDCDSGTGCYMNCGGTTGWRPVKENTVMMSQEGADGDVNLVFDAISYAHLLDIFAGYR